MPINQKELAINSFQNVLAYNNSLEFDGSNDYVNVGDQSELRITSNLTLEAWVKWDGQANINTIMAKKTTSSSNPGYSLYVNTFNTSDGAVILETESGNAVKTSTALAIGNWVHVALTVSGGGSPKIYFNGVNQPLSSSGVLLNSGTAAFNIGCFSNLVWFFDGEISEVRVWDVTRTQEEIKNNRSKRLRGTESGLVGYWRLDEGTGTTAVDSSSSSNDGTLTNFPTDPWSSSVPPVYQRTFKERYEEFAVSDFSSSINSGLGQATITIPKRIDQLGEGEQIGNDIEINVYDKDAPAGVKVYSGQIEEVRKLTGTTEEVELVVEGYVRGLAEDYVKNYDSQYRFDLSSADLGTQFKIIIDYFNYHNPRSPITYDDSDIAVVGVSRIINIDNQSYLDTLNQIREIAGADYYFYLTAENKMIFTTFSSGFDKIFTLEGDVATLEETTTVSEVKNGLLFAGGSSNNRSYFDETSQFKFGNRIEQKKDERFTNTDSMDSFGSSFIAIRKDPFTVLNLEILDSNYDESGFDIENVRPGQTLILNNTGRSESTRLITNLTYSIGIITVTTQDVQRFVERELHELKERVQRISYGGDGPVTYTNVS